jgi:hypothetical protein
VFGEAGAYRPFGADDDDGSVGVRGSDLLMGGDLSDDLSGY